MQRVFNLNFLAVTAGILAFILYGSLYPFAFHTGHGPGPLRALLETWANSPRRGDFAANLLLYMPFGLFGALSLAPRLRFRWRVMLVVFAGASLSIAIEFIQYFDANRFSSAPDVYANVVGTMIGAMASGWLAPWLSRRIRQFTGKPFPSVLLAAWVGYRLYPFIPVIDLHKYWAALQPVLLNPVFSPYHYARYAISWLVVAALLEAIGERRRSRWMLPVFVAGILFAKVIAFRNAVDATEVAAIATAYPLWLFLVTKPERKRAAVLAVLVGVHVLVWRAAWVDLPSVPAYFERLPLFAFILGPIAVVISSMCEKIFYYGALLWLMGAAGLRLPTAAISVAVLLLAASVVAIATAGPPVQVTDAVLVLLLAAVAGVSGRTPAEHAPRIRGGI